MKTILLILLFPLSVLAQQWGTLTPDLLVSMNTSTVGTTLTGSIADAGTVSSKCTVGTNCSFTTVTMCASCFQVGAWQPNMQNGAGMPTCSNLGPVQMSNGGALFSAHSLNYNNLSHADSGNNTNAYESFSNALGLTQFAVLYCVTLGPPLQTSSGSDWDIVGIWDQGGDYWETQLNNNCTSGGSNNNYGIRIETKPTAHSACVPLAAQSTYWVEEIANTSTGYAQMWVWSAGGELMGTVSRTAGDFGTNVRYIQIGNNENGNNSGTTTYFQNIMAFWSGVSCTSGSCNPIFWADNGLGAGVLSPNRGSYWNPGVVGDIPTNRTQCVNTQCATVTAAGTSVTSAQINAALSNAPANTFVLLPSGHLSSATAGITFGGVSNVTLRGAGANQTYLAPTTEVCSFFSICLGTTSNFAGTPQNGPVSVTGDTTQGSSTITLASVTNLKVGNPIILDQLDPTADAGGIFQIGTNSTYTPSALASPGLAGAYSTAGGNNAVRNGCAVTSPTNCYHQQQIVTVTQCDGNTTTGHACSSGAAITIYPALHAPNWNTTNMFAWWATSPSLNDGLEDMNVDSSGNTGAIGIGLDNCQGCWVKGVTSYDTAEAHLQLRYSNQATIRSNYFFLTQNAATSSYGVECFSCSDDLVENNIFQTVTTPMLNNGPSSGNVWAYNFTVNELYTGSSQYSIPAIGNHAGGIDSNLFEGNITDGVTGDNIHGTDDFSTFFRNVFSVQPACWSSGSFPSITYAACNNNYTPFQDFSFHRFYSLVGNVLGGTGTGQSHYCNGGTACSSAFTQSNTNVLMIGGGNTILNDSNVVNTFMAWGNSDPVTGFSTPRFNCSDVPTFPASGALNSTIIGVQLPFLNACPASQTLPSSFYSASKPVWWPSGAVWPPIGPDITGGDVQTTTGTAYSHGPTLATNTSQVGGATLSTYANGYVNAIPAMKCYLATLGGTADGSGTSELSFNENTCYGGSGPTPTGSQIPSGNEIKGSQMSRIDNLRTNMIGRK